MLEFSNSQSCKEFTLEGEFYRRYTVHGFRAEKPLSRDYIDVYRYKRSMQIVSP